MSDTRLLNIEVEDTSAAILRFKSGAIGAFEATVAARPKNLEGSLSILGENGSIVIGGQAVNEIKSWSFTNISEEESKEICKKWSRKVANVYGTGHVPNIMDIIEVVRDNKESSIVCDSVQGKKNVQLLAALYESAACDGEVKKMGSESRKSLLGKEK
jgi:predicted dehydrogenase